MHTFFLKSFVGTVAVTLLLVATDGWAATGRTPGTFAVSPTGAATYSMPIWVPPGPRGIQPSLALTYDSNADNGIVGVGWNLSGLSAIALCSRTVAQDGATSGTPDRYCLDGQRLRKTSGTNYGDAGSTYQTEIANFSQVTALSTGTTRYFTVQGKDGLNYEYGNTIDSRIILGGTAAQWLLDKVSNRDGASYTITYQTGQAGTTGTVVPKMMSWGPASAGSSSYNYSVQFTYALRPAVDQIQGSFLGVSVTNTNRLSSVTVNHGATVVRYYSLAYDTSPVTSRSRLLSLTECADVAMSNCLSPTSASYVINSTGLTGTSLSAAASSSTYGGAADFNGDGRSDLWYILNGTIYVAYGTATGVATPVATSITGIASGTKIFTGDLAGTGKSDFMVPIGSLWYRYYLSGSAFVGVSTGLTVNTTNTAYGLADVNGDGLPDLITTYFPAPAIGPTRYAYVNFNTSTNHTASFGALVTVSSMPGTNCIPNAGACVAYLAGVADVTGDKGADIGFGRLIIGGGAPPPTVTWYSWNGTAFTGVAVSASPNVANAVGVKWNDDKCADLLGTTSGSYGVQISGCNGTLTSFIALPGSVGTMDWDGDGRMDVLVRTASNTLGVQLSNGSGVGSVTDTGIPLPTTTSVYPADVNGDGQMDLVFVSGVAPFAVGYMLHNASASGLPDQLSSVTDGYGVSSSMAYATLADPSVYTIGTGAVSPEVDTADPLNSGDQTGRHFMVVKSITQSDGVGGTYVKTYSYAGARKNTQGRGYDGFQSVRVSDSRANTPVRVSNYRTDFPYTGMMTESDVYQNNGTTLISKTVNTQQSPLAAVTLDSTVNNQRYFPYNTTSVTTTNEVGGTRNGLASSSQTTTYTYNASDFLNGNLTSVATVTTDTDANSPYVNLTWNSSTGYSYSVADTGTNWCLGVPTQVQNANVAPAVLGLSASNITRTSSVRHVS